MSYYSSFLGWLYSPDTDKTTNCVTVNDAILADAIKKLKITSRKRQRPRDWNTKTDITQEFNKKMRFRKNILDWNATYPDKKPTEITRRLSCDF